MWSPTHVQVTVYRARNLLVKGKSGTNDAYVTIKLSDEKYQTSIKERTTTPEWMEECDLPFVEMTDTVHLNAYHRNLLGIDEFLGHVDIPLDQFKIHERPRSRWYALGNKPGSKKADKYRGEIEVKVTFIVQSMSGSGTLLPKSSTKSFKRSSSIKTLAHNMGDMLTVKWPSKGSLKSEGKLDGSATPTESGDQSPTVRKFDRRDHLTRSHTILPTSFNNQHLQEEQQEADEVDSTGTNEDSKGPDLERWTNPMSSFHRKKKSRLSKMNILSQSSLNIDAEKRSPVGDNESESDAKSLEPLLEKQMMAKSMFDLRTAIIDELTKEPQQDLSRNELETETGNSKDVGSLATSVSVDGEAQGSSPPLAYEDTPPLFDPLSPALSQSSGFSTSPMQPDYQERGIDVDFTRSKPSSPPLSPPPVVPSDSVVDTPPSSPNIPPPKPVRAASITPDSHETRVGDNSELTVKDASPDVDVPDTKVIASNHPDPKPESSKVSETKPAKTEDKVELTVVTSESEEDVPVSSPNNNNKSRLTTLSRSDSLGLPGEKSEVDAERQNEKYKKMKEVNRRHTLRHNVARAAVPDLHAGILQYKMAQEQKDKPLPVEVMDQFKEHSREDLVRLILEQRHLLHKRDTYNRDLEDYIDNLLVKVMEVTPKLLAHPSTRPSPPKTHRGISNGFGESPVNGQDTLTSRFSGAPNKSLSPVHSSVPLSPSSNQRSDGHGQLHGSSNQRVTNSDTSRQNAINANNSTSFTVISRTQVNNQRNNNAKKQPFNPIKKIQQALK